MEKFNNYFREWRWHYKETGPKSYQGYCSKLLDSLFDVMVKLRIDFPLLLDMEHHRKVRRKFVNKKREQIDILINMGLIKLMIVPTGEDYLMDSDSYRFICEINHRFRSR